MTSKQFTARPFATLPTLLLHVTPDMCAGLLKTTVLGCNEASGGGARGERRAVASGGKVGAVAAVAVARPAGRANTRVSVGESGGGVRS